MKPAHLWLKDTLDELSRSGRVPRLLLHSCCAPCSSAVLERLAAYFEITVWYDNPNLSPQSEFEHRASEQARLLREMPLPRSVALRVAPYDPAPFSELARGHEEEPEGGERCYACYRLRLRRTAELAAAEGFDYFGTTLSVSPYKHADWLNRIGEELSAEYGVPFLYADFKKNDGYKRSCALSAEYALYRQSYCGCAFSRAAAVREGRLVVSDEPTAG